MILSSVHLKNFRKHSDLNLSFSGKLNYITGGNGQGKTSVLESIYYLCTTKGYNSKNDGEVVRFNESGFEVNGSFKDLTESDILIRYSSGENKKYYFQNGKQVHRPSEIIGKYPVVILTPADISITKGSPSERRKFVDSVISQASETYLKILIDYNRTLKQRSSLLNQLREGRYRVLPEELDAWTQKLIQSGTEIIKHRIKFTEDFNGYIRRSYKVIMDDSEVPEIKYSFLDDTDGGTVEDKFRGLVEKKRDEELRRAVNLVGPHRDDFIYGINGVNLKTFGSQGQHKTFQVVLRFAEFFYLKEITGRTPIFLLDDVFGELDINRSSRISEYLSNVGQAFITLTDFTNLTFLKRNKDDMLIKIENGNFIYA